METEKKKAIWILSVLWIPIFILLSAVVWQTYKADQSRSNIPFDQQVWAASTPASGADSTRLRMAADLTQNFVVVGMSKQEIEVFLGSPDWNSEELPVKSYWHMGLDTQFMNAVASRLEIEFDDQSNAEAIRILSVEVD